MKKIVIIVFMLISGIVHAQNSDYCLLFNSPNAVFYGIDFTLVKFRNQGANGFNDLVKIRDSYFNAINVNVTPEVDKYSLPKCFAKYIIMSIETANLRNKTTNIDNIITSEGNIVNDEMISKLLSFYPKDNTKSEIGILIIAEELLKIKSGSSDDSFGNYKVAFFKNADHKIILTLELSGMAGGMGWSNFWTKSVINALDNINMKKLKKQYCPE
jgi:hypothetical protein